MDRIDVPTFLVGSVPGRADRRALRAQPRRAGGQRQGVAVAAERRARRLARARHDHALGRVPQALRRRRDPRGARARPVAERRAVRVPRRGRRVARAAVALRGHDRRRGRAARLRARSARAAAHGQRRRPAGPGLDRLDLGARLRRLAGPPGAGHALLPRRARDPAPRQPAGRRARPAYVADPGARPAQTLPGDGETDAWKAQPPYDWRPLAAGKGVGFTSARLPRDVDRRRRVEPRRAPALLRARHRPAGHAQRGAARRRARPTCRTAGCGPRTASSTAAPRPRWTRCLRTCARMRRRCREGPTRSCACRSSPSAHAFRAGSRIRVTVQAVGGDRPRWAFSTVDRGRTRNTIALGGARASKLVLPVVAGATAKGTPLPAADRAARAAQPRVRRRVERRLISAFPPLGVVRVPGGATTPWRSGRARPARRIVRVMKTPRVIPVPRVGPSPHAPRQ